MTETKAQQECPYCSTSDNGVQKRLLINEPSVKLETWIEPVWEGDGCFLHVQYGNYENAGRVINFCPMCGRKLGDRGAK